LRPLCWLIQYDLNWFLGHEVWRYIIKKLHSTINYFKNGLKAQNRAILKGVLVLVFFNHDEENFYFCFLILDWDPKVEKPNCQINWTSIRKKNCWTNWKKYFQGYRNSKWNFSITNRKGFWELSDFLPFPWRTRGLFDLRFLCV